jgi:hypothetical protein
VTAADKPQAPAPAAEPLSLFEAHICPALDEAGITRPAERWPVAKAMSKRLSPRDRLALAAELLAPLGHASISITSPKDWQALAGEGQAEEEIKGHKLLRSAWVRLGSVSAHLFEQRPATREDAARLLPEEK